MYASDSNPEHDDVRQRSITAPGDHFDQAPPLRGWTWLAWLAILSFVGFLTWIQNQAPAAQAAQFKPFQEDALALVVTQLRMRVVAGAVEAQRHFGQPPTQAELQKIFDENAGPEDTGTLGQRFRRAILANEVLGAEEAQKRLATIEFDLQREGLKIPEDQNRIRRILSQLFRDYQAEKWDAPSVLPPERDFLQSQLGWSGELALVPPQSTNVPARQHALLPAWRTFGAMVGVLGGGLLLGLLGCLGVLAYFVSVLSGSLRTGIGPPRVHSGIYAETFALWLVMMLGVDLLLTAFARADGDRLLWNAVGNASTLIVLVWPLFRGLEWSQVCEDIGLTAGRRGVLEVGYGFVAYVMTLPFLALGVIAMLVLAVVYAGVVEQQAAAAPAAAVPVVQASSFLPEQSIPAHPIIQHLGSDLWQVGIVFVLAVVLAPILEEIMFRGLLYRQLRDGSRWLGPVLSVLFSTFWNTLIFAAIHPQGLIAVPALMGLACGMTLAREWRGSLIASITCHALNNGIVLTVALLILT